MIVYDEEKMAEFRGNFTIRLMGGIDAIRASTQSPSALPGAPVPQSDRAEAPEDGPAVAVGCGGRCRRVPNPAVRNIGITDPSRNRSGTASGSSNPFGALGRWISHRNRVAPLGTHPPGPLGTHSPGPPGPGPAPAPGPSTESHRTSASAAESSEKGPSSGRPGRGAPTNKMRWSMCPWTSPSPSQGPLTVDSSKSRTSKPRGHRIIYPNRVAPLAANQAGGPSELSGTPPAGIHKTAAVGDIPALGTSNGRLEGTESERSRPMLLARFLGLITGCIGKRTSRPSEEPRSHERPLNSQDEDQGTGTTTARHRPAEKLGCLPCAKPLTVAPAPSPRRTRTPKFWVGSRDTSEESGEMGCTIGPVASWDKIGFQQQDSKKLKTTANQQTSVTVEELERAAQELQNDQDSRESLLPVQLLPKPAKDETPAYPTIDEKDLRQVVRESGKPIILGRGQSGLVRLMRLKKPGGGSTLVAVKRLMGDVYSCQDALTRELGAMRAVEHCPIFPRLVGVVSKQSFAQEFIGNPKSFTTLSITKSFQGRPQISQLNWTLIIHDVLVGLSALHRAGWAHCDLQTNNVLLWRDRDQSNEPKTRWLGRIIDLGNAKRLEGPTTYCLHLSPSSKAAYYRDCRHIPPEIVEGLVPYNVASDVYSMGMLMRDIAAKVACMMELLPLAESCLVQDPDQRPSLKTLREELDLWCYVNTGRRISPEEQSRVITYV